MDDRSPERTSHTSVASGGGQGVGSPIDGYSCPLLEGPTVPYDLREHTADVAVEATGESLGDAFAAAADGMAAAMCEDVPAAGDDHAFAVTAESRESLLFDYLDELIYVRDVEDVLPVDNRAVVEGADGTWRVDASARVVPLELIAAREVKAVTYSEMIVEETADGWRVYVVLDV